INVVENLLPSLGVIKSSKGKRSKNGEMYFNEFQTQFWLRLGKFPPEIFSSNDFSGGRSRNRYSHNPSSQTFNRQQHSLRSSGE
ncbi:64_t:CDS:2, partial [Funneliformis mosseae]